MICAKSLQCDLKFHCRISGRAYKLVMIQLDNIALRPGDQYMDAGDFLPRFLRSVSEKINLCCQEKMLDSTLEIG